MFFYGFIMVLSYFAKGCFVYICESLDSGVCAELITPENNTISINDLGCNGGHCKKSTVESEFSSGETQSLCLEESTSTSAYTIVINYQVDCGIRNNDVLDRYMNISTYMFQECPGLCYSESGETSECLCGYDGKEYCQPNKSSAIFDEFWKICVKNNTIDYKTSLLWDYILNHFVDILTAPYCVDDVFTEIQSPSLDYIIDSYGHWLLFILLAFTLF